LWTLTDDIMVDKVKKLYRVLY